MKPEELKDLGDKVLRATLEGQIAARHAKDDGGSANLDHIVLTGLKGIRENSLAKVGIRGWRHKGGFHLSTHFDGQGNRRYAAVQAMSKSLTAAGVEHYIHYQMD